MLSHPLSGFRLFTLKSRESCRRERGGPIYLALWLCASTSFCHCKSKCRASKYDQASTRSAIVQRRLWRLADALVSCLSTFDGSNNREKMSDVYKCLQVELKRKSNQSDVLHTISASETGPIDRIMMSTSTTVGGPAHKSFFCRYLQVTSCRYLRSHRMWWIGSNTWKTDIV